VEGGDYGADPMQNPQYMADMTAAGTPGPQHKMLAGRAGSWKVAGKMWMEPGTEAMPMNATAKTQVLLGDRYIVEEFKSDFMGMPFEGRLFQGYDNLTQQYWSVWTDNMSTGYMISHGTETSPGKIEFEGTASDILTPNGRSMRMTTTTHSDGSYTMKMFDTRKDSGEFQSMELHYTRG
jgi:hypothetical protein